MKSKCPYVLELESSQSIWHAVQTEGEVGGWGDSGLKCQHFYSLQKRMIQVQCPLVFRYNHLFWFVSPVVLGPPDVWMSLFKWQGRPRETPMGPAVPGLQRPGDPAAVREETSVWRWDNLCRTEPRAVRLSDRLISGNPPRKKPLSAKGSREKKPSLIAGTLGIKAWPSLIN